jgi:hypothetical protein
MILIEPAIVDPPNARNTSKKNGSILFSPQLKLLIRHFPKTKLKAGKMPVLQ